MFGTRNNNWKSNETSPGYVQSSELRSRLTRKQFEEAFFHFMEQADKNAVTKRSEGKRTPYGITNNSFDGAKLTQHFGQGAPSKTPYLNRWVVSIYYLVESRRIVLGIETDRYRYLSDMKPIRLKQIGNKKTNVAVFYESTIENVNYGILYSSFLSVSEQVMELGLE
ncbi:MAG: hypothetical protein K6F14_04720 [Clostridiales bacterium]|nr:hypothetical protein [Clostridiales bacterium]